MKMKQTDLPKVKEILRKLNLDLGKELILFFPLDLPDTYVDELGMPATKYKAETFYGNQLLAGVGMDEYNYPAKPNSVSLVYAQTTQLYTFNLAGILNLNHDYNISEEDKCFLLQFESAVTEHDKCFITNMPLC